MTKQNPQKVLTILAGPNGAGKTTFAKRVYPDSIEKGYFLNADHLAEEIMPNDVSSVAIKAGRHLLDELDTRLKGNQPILIETTLSGKSLFRKIKLAQDRGFLVRLVFLRITTVTLCDFRVKSRVISGGHNIPLREIQRRYHRGIHNLSTYMNTVDEYEIFLATEEPVLMASKEAGQEIIVHAPSLYDELKAAMVPSADQYTAA